MIIWERKLAFVLYLSVKKAQKQVLPTNVEKKISSKTLIFQRFRGYNNIV